MNALGLCAAGVLAATCAIGNVDAAARSCSDGLTDGACAEAELKDGLVLAGGYRIGSSVVFDDGVGITDGTCFALSRGRRVVAWIADYHQTGGVLYVKRCIARAGRTGQATRAGYVRDVFDRVGGPNAAGALRFDTIRPPQWSDFANPSFCGRYVAYWGVEHPKTGPARLVATVLDLSSNRVAKRLTAASMEIESDSRELLPRPRWNADGTAATFDLAAAAVPEPRGGPTSLTLTIR